MNAPELAPHFCQVAWVVKDIATAETFFTQIMGVSSLCTLTASRRTTKVHIWANRGIGSFVSPSRTPVIRRSSSFNTCPGKAYSRTISNSMVTRCSIWRIGLMSPSMMELHTI